MARHPAGKGAGTHVVAAGETLWEIAAVTLGTDDAGSIAAYWPRIYRHNQGVLTHGPHLIRPGQVLYLPAVPPGS